MSATTLDYSVRDALHAEPGSEAAVVTRHATLEEALHEWDLLTAENPRGIYVVRGHEMDEAHDLVVAHLHYSGEMSDALSGEEQYEVYCLGDGYGPGLTAEDLAEINEGWDWSHVRDSTPRAWLAMAERVRQLTGGGA